MMNKTRADKNALIDFVVSYRATNYDDWGHLTEEDLDTIHKIKEYTEHYTQIDYIWRLQGRDSVIQNVIKLYFNNSSGENDTLTELAKIYKEFNSLQFSMMSKDEQEQTLAGLKGQGFDSFEAYIDNMVEQSKQFWAQMSEEQLQQMLEETKKQLEQLKQQQGVN